MSSKPNRKSFDLSALTTGLTGQFRELNFKEPGQWPLAPKAVAWVITAAVVVGIGWLLILNDVAASLQAERDREPALKADYRSKLAQAVNLAELKKQKEQVQEYVIQLEKQLPGKAEMDALLSDINQAAIRVVQAGAGGGQGLLRRTAHRHQGQRALSRHRCVCLRHCQPVAHRHVAQPDHQPATQGSEWCAEHGSHGAHLPLPRRS